MMAFGTRADFEPIVVSSGEGDLPGQLAAGGVEFHALPLATKWSFLANTWRLAGLIRSIRPRVIHLHGHFAASVSQLAVFLAGRPPTVYSVRWPASPRVLPCVWCWWAMVCALGWNRACASSAWLAVWSSWASGPTGPL